MSSTQQTQNTPLAGKVAIVTGGSRGIGAAIALEFAKRGAKVALTFVSPSSAAAASTLVATINALGNGSAAIAIQADARSPSSPARIVAATAAAFGPCVDILVNNAGVSHAAPLASVDGASLAALLDTNVLGVIYMTQAVLPALRSPGRVINVSSVLARVGHPGASFYGASKAAVEALARGWAAELGGAGHTVNAIAPALTETDMMAQVVGEGGAPSEAVQMQRVMTPMEHRLAKAEDIALVAALLADPASRWITGQTIEATGGLYMN